MHISRGHVLVFALGLSSLVVACSSSSSGTSSTTDTGTGSDTGSGPAAQVQTDCKAFCDVISAKATGCPSTAADSCKGLCALYAGVSSQACADKLSAMWKCQQGQTWSCSSGSDVPTSTDSTCSAEVTAMSSACGTGPKDAGTSD